MNVLPTLNQIFDGLIAESIIQLIATSGLPKKSIALKRAQNNFINAWKKMLNDAAIDEKDRNTPLTGKILLDPTHKIVLTLLTIYCHEGFV